MTDGEILEHERAVIEAAERIVQLHLDAQGGRWRCSSVWTSAMTRLVDKVQARRAARGGPPVEMSRPPDPIGAKGVPGVVKNEV